MSTPATTPPNLHALSRLADADLAQPLPHGFRALGDAFGTALPTSGLPQPHWVAASAGMARELGLGEQWQSNADVLQVLAGNVARPPASQPAQTPLTWASVYSGHQFGVWAGQLGDGRATSLGSLQDSSGQWQELQLKGAGRTPYSRMGDGRAVLRSSIREFLASEAMAALGVPTTRALALVGSTLPVAREAMETAAIVTRVAPSFIRFGHFEHFAARGDLPHLSQLTEFVVSNFMPECRAAASQFDGKVAAALLAEVSQRTARLFAQFQALGFCHGVLNTDNMSILGLAIDYGPFQFMDGFNPSHVCNHSDHAGRYAYKNQPSVAYWNLFCLAQALMPLIDDEQLVLRAVEPFQQAFSQALAREMGAKLGLIDRHDTDGDLVQQLLQLLAAERVDWPVFWRRLSHDVARDFGAPTAQALAQPTQRPVTELFAATASQAALGHWLTAYRQRIATQDRADTAARMLRTNPEYMLRNHLCEQAIAQAQTQNFDGVHRLLARVQAPYTSVEGAQAFSDIAPDWAANIAISCSS